MTSSDVYKMAIQSGKHTEAHIYCLPYKVAKWFMWVPQSGVIYLVENAQSISATSRTGGWLELFNQVSLVLFWSHQLVKPKATP